MDKKIGIAVAFLNADRLKKIEDIAKTAGFELKILDSENLKQEDLLDCEILFGMFPAKLLKACTQLKWMHCSFAGVDRYVSDQVYANSSVVVTNSAGAYGVTISEHIMTVLLMLVRRMPEYAKLQSAKDWHGVGQIRSVINSKIAIIGTGDIGSNFARRARAMGATTIGVRRKAGDLPDFDQMFVSEDMDKAIADADVVVACVPQTENTRKLIDAKRIAAMKDGAIFINVGRGTAVDQAALNSALRSGKLYGAAIDVTDPEPLPQDSPLWTAPNLIITPHISGNLSLPLTCDILTDIFADNLERYAVNKPLTHVVDRKVGY